MGETAPSAYQLERIQLAEEAIAEAVAAGDAEAEYWARKQYCGALVADHAMTLAADAPPLSADQFATLRAILAPGPGDVS